MTARRVRRRKTSGKRTRSEEESEDLDRLSNLPNDLLGLSTVNNSSGDSDRLSNLPDDLLVIIISNLPIKEAVATSILSRRWRYQWKHISISHLDLKLQISEFTKSKDFYVNNLINKLSVPCIKTCRITQDCNESDGRDDRLKYTVQYLLNNMATEEIAIGYDRMNYSCRLGGLVAMDTGLFSGTRLRKLEIKDHWIDDESPFHGCENLETLMLIGVSISDETLANIIRVCGLLENLGVEYCGRLREFEIYGNTKLKRLKFKGLRLYKFHVHADGLEFLSINSLGRFSWHDFLINCPELRALKLHCGPESFRLWKTLDNRVFGNRRLCIPNLMVLHITMDLNTECSSLILCYLFRECTKLQEVDIVNKADKDNRHEDIPDEEDFWRTYYLDSISKHVRLFRIGGFKGRQKEMRLVDYVITNASKLEKLLIHFDRLYAEEEVISKLQEKDKLEILSKPSASLDVSIIFE